MAAFDGDLGEQTRSVIIIGAGPAGLFLALKMAQHGIRVLVLERGQGIVQSPRACIYMPIVLKEFEKVGIYDHLLEVGFKSPEGPTFRTPYAKDNQLLAKMNFSLIPKESSLQYDFAGIHLGQPELAALILSHAEKLPNFEVKWGHRFSGVQQRDKDGVAVCVVTPTGEKLFEADYLVGCDGAGSAVRRALCIPWEGTTWTDFRFMATNVNYDFEKYGFGIANTVIDEADWAIIVRVSPGPTWRVAYGIKDGMDLSFDECLKTIPEKYERLFPGPRPLKYEIVSANPYVAQQRCAAKFRDGRVILCSDAAHCNSPIGGLGLTTGLLDAAALGNCLIRIMAKNEADPDSLLDHYAKVRRDAWLGYTNSQSTENTLRLWSTDKEVIDRRTQFFDRLNTDPSFHIELAEAMNAVLVDNFEA